MTDDMSPSIVPKSDQLNADDMLTGPRTVTITKIKINPEAREQLVWIYCGDDAKPYKPCKSMCRVLVAAWGPDSKQYVGKSMTLFRDPHVKWAGVEVGGIRISHMSHLERDIMTLALTETKGKRAQFVVKALKSTPPAERPHAPAPPHTEQKEVATRIRKALEGCDDAADLTAIWDLNEPTINQMPDEWQKGMKHVFNKQLGKIEAQGRDEDERAEA